MAFTGHRQALSQEALEEMLMNKYGTITRAHDGVRGDKRWKIEYGDVVYITDEQQKLVITTYQIRPHRHPLADLPPWSSGPHDPPFFLKKQIHEGYARNI